MMAKTLKMTPRQLNKNPFTLPLPLRLRPTLATSLLAATLLTVVLILLPTPVLAQHAVITVYHHVSEDTPPSTSISPDDFRAHLQYLADNNFTVWRLDRLLQALEKQSDMPDKVAVLTFDDAYESIYTTAMPMLAEYDYPMTLFVSTQPVDDQQSGYLTWGQIREMSEAGHMIANHTVNHPHLIDAQPGESDADRISRVRHEILTAEARIEEETGQAHKILAYPYGEFDQPVLDLMDELGFIGIAQNSGAVGYHSDTKALPRFPLASIYASLDTASTKLNSLAFEIKEQTPRSPITDSRRPAVTLQLAGDFTVDQLGCYAGGEPLNFEWIDREAVHFRIEPNEGVSFDSRRFGYICTARRADGRYFWFNKFWVRSTPENAD